MKFKYIILENDDSPILFPEHIDHWLAADKFKYAGEKNVISAGIVSFYIENDDIKANCIMGSHSLKIERNEEREEIDSDIITRLVKRY